MHPDIPHHDAQQGRHQEHSTDGQAEILDLDAEALAEDIASTAAWLPLNAGTRQIVDLGAARARAPSPCSSASPKHTSPLSTRPPDTSST
ncbi:hypothetical protein [Streptomyces lomondensis]|uniref:Uncharacterized protein n=1 Tax=Streptomyces lomondensis TaxID=68229 RepID=A0ABQ2X491_9ACTN|nr:hypothetical protein [Streptomyces lomondensis]GGW98326.1 hypothetical protein GCM10010383_30670 [Streptomyces lomondensis]